MARAWLLAVLLSCGAAQAAPAVRYCDYPVYPPISWSDGKQVRGLAPTVVHEVFNVIRDLRGRGLTLMLVEQNVAASLRLADRAYVLETGRIVLSGRGEELLGDPRVKEAYLGL